MERNVMNDYHKELGKAVESAAEKLPEGYTINIVLERNTRDAVLYDADGEECEFTSNHESLADVVNDAVEFASRDCNQLAISRNERSVLSCAELEGQKLQICTVCNKVGTVGRCCGRDTHRDLEKADSSA